MKLLALVALMLAMVHAYELEASNCDDVQECEAGGILLQAGRKKSVSYSDGGGDDEAQSKTVSNGDGDGDDEPKFPFLEEDGPKALHADSEDGVDDGAFEAFIASNSTLANSTLAEIDDVRSSPGTLHWYNGRAYRVLKPEDTFYSQEHAASHGTMWEDWYKPMEYYFNAMQNTNIHGGSTWSSHTIDQGFKTTRWQLRRQRCAAEMGANMNSGISHWFNVADVAARCNENYKSYWRQASWDVLAYYGRGILYDLPYGYS